MNWFRSFFRKRTLVPYNYGAPDCPKLAVGDRLLGIQENEAQNYIAGLCGMDMRLKAGYKVTWRVKEVYSAEGDALIEAHGCNRALTKYIRWDDGNRATVEATLAYSEIRIRFYKLV